MTHSLISMSWMTKRLTGDTQPVTRVCMPTAHLGTHGKRITQRHSPWGCAVNTLFKGISVKISYKLCLLHKVTRVLGVNSKCAQGFYPLVLKREGRLPKELDYLLIGHFGKYIPCSSRTTVSVSKLTTLPPPAALAPHSLSTLLTLRKRSQLTPL